MSSREEAAADKAAAAADGKNLERPTNEYDVVIEEILDLGCRHSLTDIFSTWLIGNWNSKMVTKTDCHLRGVFCNTQPLCFRPVTDLAETRSGDSVGPKNLLETHIF